MLITEIVSSDLSEKQIWGRRGKKLVRKYRCASGLRKGRIVANMAQCFASPNIKKKLSMKRTRARLGARMARKARRTKRTNPASIALRRLNKRKR
jgi:hypothetical protein|tara:strand:+ start:637 stop:921 length:285 start_codon:yes stop_codon:yes gene_type:complete